MKIYNLLNSFLNIQNTIQSRLLSSLIFIILFSPTITFGQPKSIPSFNIWEAGSNSVSYEKAKQFKALYLIPSRNQGSIVQVGYSPFRHFNVDLGYTSSNLNYLSRYGDNIQKGNNLSASGGFYYSVNLNGNQTNKKPQTQRVDFNFSFNLGIVAGKLNTHIDETYARLNYDKKFYQFGLGFKTKNWRIDFFTKIFYLNFNKGEIYNMHLIEEIQPVISIIENESSFRMINNKIQLSCGHGYINFVMGISTERQRDRLEKYRFLDTNNAYFGVIIDLNEVHKKIVKIF